MSKPSEEVQYALAAIEAAVKLLGDSEALMRNYAATTKDNIGVRALVQPMFHNAVDFLDQHAVHMANVKMALAKYRKV